MGVNRFKSFSKVGYLHIVLCLILENVNPEYTLKLITGWLVAFELQLEVVISVEVLSVTQGGCIWILLEKGLDGLKVLEGN